MMYGRQSIGEGADEALVFLITLTIFSSDTGVISIVDPGAGVCGLGTLGCPARYMGLFKVE